MGDMDDFESKTTHINLAFKDDDEDESQINNNIENKENQDNDVIIKLDDVNIDQADVQTENKLDNGNKTETETETDSLKPEVNNKRKSVVKISEEPDVIDVIKDVQGNGDVEPSNLENEHVIDIDSVLCTSSRRPSSPEK